MNYKTRCKLFLARKLLALLSSKGRMRCYGRLAALGVSIVLLIAALGKLLYPSTRWHTLDLWTGGVELLLICVLLWRSTSRIVWSALSLIFALWAGYNIFWWSLGRPCGCFGEMLRPASGFSLTLVLILFSLSVGMAFLFGVRRTLFYLLITLCIPLGYAGYAFGSSVQKRYEGIRSGETSAMTGVSL